MTKQEMQKIKLAPNFTLWELVRSDTAMAKGIDNSPNVAEIKKLKLLAEHILQPVRDNFKKPVRVNGAFRSVALNAVTKGASLTSQHCKAEAVDFEIDGVDNGDLAEWIDKNLDYDQLILEYHGDDSKDANDGWVH